MRQAHYVLSTHWDREWYQTFQDFRFRLVQLLDRVLEGWQNEELQGPFQTDGQAILLEDYLEVRPERAAQVHALVREGRFLVGPWYVLPDEFLVSGEALIRNLQLGRATARSMGGTPSNAGFLCDMFGHNSQMPQILAGFGIRGAFLWRGINLIDSRLFRWRGADGTEMPAYRFGRVGYCSFAAQVRGTRGGPRPEAKEIEERLQFFLEEEDAATPAGPLLLFDGGDHMQWDAQAYSILARHFQQEGAPYQMIHSSLDAYLDAMQPFTGQIPITVEGELREPGRYPEVVDEQWLIPGVSSSRVPIKLANAACQNLLCQWAEPLSAFASSACDAPYPRGFLDVAWKWLLQNHPHDSICGCSIDAVHEDMFYRFHQCQQIASRVTRLAAGAIARSAAGTCPADEQRVVVFNPLLRPFDGVADITIELPTDWPMESGVMGRFEPKPAFRILDAAGEEIPYQRGGQQMNRTRFRTPAVVFPEQYAVNTVQVSLPLRIPACGYTTLSVLQAWVGEPAAAPSGTVRVTGPSEMENEALRLSIARDGSLNITDLRNGENYRHLLTWEDWADIGDGWNFGPAANDAVVTSSGGSAEIALIAGGPYRASFRMRQSIPLPEEFDFGSMARSSRRKELLIESTITLRAGADWVEVETAVENTVKDHRLRALFPSGAQAERCWMDSPFDVVERPIALRTDNEQYREREVDFKPQQSFTAVFDGVRGLAVASTGLMESGVLDRPDRPIAMTFLRATRRTVFTDGEPGGQVQGSLRFRFWIVPSQGEPDRARLLDLAQRLSGGLLAIQPALLDNSEAPAGSLPSEAGFLAVRGPVVVTSLRREGETTELRLFNPNSVSVEAGIDFTGSVGISLPARLEAVDFESHPAGTAYPVEDGQAVVPLGPKKILTLRF